MSGRKLADNEIWRTRPHLFMLFECQWPITDIFPPNEATKAEEIKGTTDVTHVYLSTEEGELCGVRLDEVIDCTQYRDFNKLLHEIGYVLKFKSLVQRTQASQKRKCYIVHQDQLTGDDINATEVLWIRSIQADSFSVELTYFRSKFNPLRTVVIYMHQGNKYLTVHKQIIITSPTFTL